MENTQAQRVHTPEIRRLDLPNTLTMKIPTNRRATRFKPTLLYQIGTIIHRKCEIDNLFQEGEIMIYNPTNNL